MQLRAGAIEQQYILWLLNLTLQTERKSPGNLHFMPLPGVQVYVVQVIQSVVLQCKMQNVSWNRIMKAEQIHNCCIYIHFLTLYRPPNTYPLFPTVAQAWAALGNGLFPCVRPHKKEECQAG